MKIVMCVLFFILAENIWLGLYLLNRKKKKSRKNNQDTDFGFFFLGLSFFFAGMSILVSYFDDSNGFYPGMSAIVSIFSFIFGVAAPFTYEASSGINKE